MLKGQFQDVLRGLVGVSRGETHDVEGLAHQAVS